MELNTTNEEAVSGRRPDEQTSLGLAGGMAASAAARQANEGGAAAVERGQAPIEAGRGAPPTNRAPSKCNKLFEPLRLGVDSLYPSYQGSLDLNMDERLSLLKKKAQDKEELDQSLAQLPIGKHLFEVQDRGAGRFPMSWSITASAFKSKGLQRNFCPSPMFKFPANTWPLLVSRKRNSACASASSRSVRWKGKRWWPASIFSSISSLPSISMQFQSRTGSLGPKTRRSITSAIASAVGRSARAAIFPPAFTIRR